MIFLSHIFEISFAGGLIMFCVMFRTPRSKLCIDIEDKDTISRKGRADKSKTDESPKS